MMQPSASELFDTLERRMVLTVNHSLFHRD